ncbi:hypothetical protein G5T42_09430 [Microbacterium sp. 4R-513]|uniref:hypothetical protein n=1 Tax=Microbacterium sp. 4R-513 TaxID=2567934 RepID=UPI0013E10CCD|nr:hypothetical protein [Microbacterium sp. 4R-513]QIG39677.1 hypothetical protein G5T42_09430 [Microbacterium sp. 4R-513]
MSTTGNENEQPGVNYPDRNDADGAAGTPAGGEPVRGDQRSMEGENAEVPVQREVENPEQAAGVPGAGAAEEGWSGSFPPPSDEPTHQAVGVGVIDDDTTDPQAAGGTPGGQSQSGQDGPTYGGQAEGGHQGQDGGRETMTVGEAQRQGALGTEQEQNLPAMSQNNANDVEKISGIVVQTRDDIASTQPERVYDVLKQRLEQSGIDLPDGEIQELARQITTGDA